MALDKDTPVAAPEDVTGGLTQNPEIEGKTPTRRAIRDVAMAQNLITTLISANRNRQIVNGRIMAKYNAERPYDHAKLASEGLGWRSNFTTKPLPQMIEKVAPRFEAVVHNMKYFTNSALPATAANSSQKTEEFRKEITATIRARKGWNNLVSDIALDNALFGYTTVACLDEFTWLPTHFAHDESFFPDGTKQHADSVQIVVLLETYLPHELFEYIKDEDAATEVGWNVKATIEAINKAVPETLRNTLGAGHNAEMWYQNAQRELTVGSSYMAGARVIRVYSLLAREVTGKVSHYRFTGDGTEQGFQEIYSKDDRFESMCDCMSLYTFQKGNKKLHGSKGIGRDIYELAGMQDRLRNEVVDSGILAGKTIVQGDFKNLHKFKMSIVGSMVIVPLGWTFIEQKVKANINDFLQLDQYFNHIVDQLVGSVSPRTFQGDRVTKAEVDFFAQREEEGKDSKIARFMTQFVDMIGMMQKRLCDPDTTEEDAKEMQKRLLKVMTREELNEIAKQPVAGTVRDLTPEQRQAIAAIAAEKRGNPLYNQRALEVEDLTARMGSDFVSKILLPEADPTELAEQQRTQIFELEVMTSGQAVPVSPRDNHEIHLQMLIPAAETLAEQILAGNASSESLEVVVNHIQEHFNRAVEAGIPKEKLAGAAGFVQRALPILAKLKEVDAQAQELAGAAGAPMPPEAQM
jgi:hypothetical protein